MFFPMCDGFGSQSRRIVLLLLQVGAGFWIDCEMGPGAWFMHCMMEVMA